MVNIFICGDITNQISESGFIGKQLATIISNADYAICHLEGPELNGNTPALFPHQKSGTIAYLKEVGFDLMLLANNHITELGADGIKHCIKTIESAGIKCIGAGLTWEDAYRPLIKEIQGIKFGFVNFCEAQVGQYVNKDQSYGYAWMGWDGIFSHISALAKSVDYVIAFMHTGLEHYSIPLPEVRDFYRKLCDAGAAAVVGSHPHCAQGWEYYDNSIIVYSLGNFYFPVREKWPEEAHSYSVILTIEKDKAISVAPICHYNNGKYVELDSNGIDTKILNTYLDDNYGNLVVETIDKAYNNLCKNLLIESICGQDERDTWKSIIRKAINYTINREKSVKETLLRREKLLLRLFENETYRWVITRHLKHKYE